MKIAILAAGAPPAALIRTFGDYPTMMERMLVEAGGRHTFLSTAVDAESGLPAVQTFDALLITGSPAAVYEGHTWLGPAKDLVRAAASAGRPAVGICFGHQLMAEAFGGRVEKSAKGWGVGRHVYEVTGAEDWMRPALSWISCAASHQDQVVAAPPGARIFARSEFCSIAAIAYSQGPAMSLQMNPEFTHDYARALLDARKGRIPEDARRAALDSLAQGSDRTVIAGWIRAFFERHA